MTVNCWWERAPEKNTCTYHEPSHATVALPDPWGHDTEVVDPWSAVPRGSSNSGSTRSPTSGAVNPA